MARPVGAARLLAGLLCLILCSACSASRVMREPDLRPVVTRVHLEGTKQLKKDRIRSRLGQRATHPLHWVPILNFVYPRLLTKPIVVTNTNEPFLENVAGWNGILHFSVAGQI